MNKEEISNIIYKLTDKIFFFFDVAQKYTLMKDQRVFDIDSDSDLDTINEILKDTYLTCIAYNKKLEVTSTTSFIPQVGFSNWTRSYISVKNGQMKIETFYKDVFFVLLIFIFGYLINIIIHSHSIVFSILVIVLLLAFRFSLVIRRIEIFNVLKSNFKKEN